MAVETPRPARDPEYYLREQAQETPHFEGNGAKILGIHGQAVDRETFLNLHDGYTTKDGQRDQKLPRYMREGRRGAFDITLNLPKCASIVKEVGGDSRVGDIMTEARTKVISEIERQAYTRNPWEQNNNLVVVPFRHPGSRANDPHSHDHLWIANLSKSSKGWKAIELAYLDMEKVSKVYSDSMVKGFRELGYRVKRVGKEYEIVGVPAEVKAKFSRRHTDIAERETEYERKKGAPLTPKAKAKLSVYDRPDKPMIPASKEEWLGRMTDEERAALSRTVRRSRSTVKRAHWADQSRAAFDRMRGITRDTHVVEHERSRGIGR